MEHRIGAERAETAGNFRYEYEADGIDGVSDTTYTGTRQNNASRRTSLFATGLYRLSRPVQLSYSIQRYESRRGLPGSVEAPDLVGRGEDTRVVGSAALLASPGKHQQLETGIGYSRLTQAFDSRARAH